MAGTGYRCTSGEETTNSNGFLFTAKQEQVLQHSILYSMTCGSMYESWGPSGYTSKPENKYVTSGTVYNGNFSISTSGSVTKAATVRGTIYSANYYTASVSCSPSDGGSASVSKEGGIVWEGDTTDVTATSNTGYYIQTINGQTVNKQGTETVSGITVNSDITIPVVFGTCAKLNYNNNYTPSSGVSETINLVPGESATIKGNSRGNYVFDGWSTTRGGTVAYRYGDTITVNVDITLYAVWTEKFSVVFHANDGTATTSTQSNCTNVSTSKLNANSFTRNRYRFLKWNTASDGTGVDVADEAALSTAFSAGSGTAGGTVNLYAVWEYTAFNVTVTKSYANAPVGVEQPNVGTLTLVRVSDGVTVATEGANGQLYYEGTAGVAYRIACSMAASGTDFLWTADGVLSGGAYENPHEFTPTSGNILTKSFVFTKKSLHTLTVTSDTAGCTASVTDPATPDEDGKYAHGRSVTVTGVPAAGYEMTLAYFGGETYTPVGNAFTIPSLNDSGTATCYFTKVPYVVGVAVDAASASAITAVAVNGAAAADCTYGDTLNLTATVDVASGFAFDGWYDGETRIATTEGYAYTAIGNRTLVAKAKVSVAMTVAARETTGPNPTPSTTPDVTLTGVENGYVTLGKSFSYELALRGWIFNAWFASSDTGRTNPIAYAQDGTITPTGNLSLKADVTSNVITNTITVVMKEDEHSYGISQDGIISTTPDADEGGWNAEENAYVFTFHGTKHVTLKSLAAIPNTLYAFNKFVDGTTEHAEPEYAILTNGNRTITAWYGSTGNRTTTLGYGTANGKAGDRTMGTFAIVGSSDPNAVISSDGTSVSAGRGHTVTVVAQPKNGYKFMGWYVQQAIGGDAYRVGTEVALTVVTNRTLYAWFAQDTSAVYEWEGSGDSKGFEWRSKTYAASKPFRPTCCRVDTEGYPLISLKVDMFSAPDTEATASATLANVASQTARRLPAMRPERYLQVCVKNDSEVDCVTVGTSMEGLAV